MKKSRKFVVGRVMLTFLMLAYAGFTHHTLAQGRELDAIPSTVAQSKYIYLTFDDGPLEGSERIDSVVLAEKINISVFLVGIVEEQSKLLQSYVKLYEENPYIDMYNHSYSHANDKYHLYYTNPENVLADIQKNDELYGFKYKIVRLPGRNMWRIGDKKRDDISSGSTSADLLAENGYKVFGWDVEWQHNPKNGSPIQSASEMAKLIERLFSDKESFTPGPVVVLMHDEMFKAGWEASELKALMDELRKDAAYVFEHIRSYPSE